MKAEKGATVTISYSVRDQGGQVVAAQGKTTRPLTFRIGGKNVFPLLEKSVIGKSVGERGSVTIPPQEGYGEYRDDLVLRLDRKSFPDDLRLTPGRAVQYQDRNGERVNFVVNAVDESSVTIDANHPWAGLHLVYEYEVLSVKGL